MSATSSPKYYLKTARRSMSKLISLLSGLSSDSFVLHFELIGEHISSSVNILLRSYNSVFSGSWHTIESKLS